jgi:hypothetical protein
MIPVVKLALRLAAAMAAAVALCAFLGRLKLLYYYKSFGVDLGLLAPGTGELLFESWFVVQNLLFVLLFWWVALKSRALWVGILAVLHALIPIAAHYAFLAHETAWARFLIDYRHTLMKLLPFAALGLVWLLQSDRREALRSARPPLPAAGMALFALVALAWSISTAKHCGSFDANLVLREPASQLPRVTLPECDGFLLRADEERLLLWEPEGFDGGEIRTRIVPRSEIDEVELVRPHQVQPGNRYL